MRETPYSDQVRRAALRGLRFALVLGVAAGLVAAGLVAPAPALATGPRTLTHRVGKGDTLSSIASTYGVTVEALKRRNKLRGDMIRLGQELKIPRGGRRPRGEGKAQLRTHVVLPGETLGGIAKRYGTTVADIRRRNHLRKGAVLRVGRRLKVRATIPARQRRRFVYTIEPGDTLTSIGKRFGMSWRDIQQLNPRAHPDRLRIGDRLTLYKDGPESTSQTVGRAAAGRLVNGEKLPPGPGYYRRNPHRSWGTNETITAILEMVATVKQKHPKAHDLVIEDLSAKKGGPLPPHKSHQSGRDVDTGMYFLNQPHEGPKRFLDFLKYPLDMPTSWTLLTALVGPDEASTPAEYVFLDYAVQKKFYDWARKRGVSKRLLGRMFQYPRGKRSMRGIIRHQHGHRNHLHIRFKCPPGDRQCH